MSEMDQEARLAAIEKKVDAIFDSVERTRRYAFMTAAITVAVIVLPLIGLMFAVPQFTSIYGGGDVSASLQEQADLYRELTR